MKLHAEQPRLATRLELDTTRLSRPRGVWPYDRLQGSTRRELLQCAFGAKARLHIRRTDHLARWSSMMRSTVRLGRLSPVSMRQAPKCMLKGSAGGLRQLAGGIELSACATCMAIELWWRLSRCALESTIRCSCHPEPLIVLPRASMPPSVGSLTGGPRLANSKPHSGRRTP